MVHPTLPAQVILDAVKQAGDVFLREFKQEAIPRDRAGISAGVDSIEERCLALLKNSLAAEFPDTPWCGSEFDYDEQRQPLDLPEYWLCDSMDGAIQYMQHLPGWTINLVLVRNGRPHFSVIYDPLSGELFHAEEDGGAYLNGQPIRPNVKTDPAVMIAVFEYGHFAARIPQQSQKIGAAVGELIQQFGVVRNYGPHGLQLAYIGAGRIDAFLQLDLDTYNWLAGILIAQEAGAEILTADGRPWTWGEESLFVAPKAVGQAFVKTLQTSVRV